jgi:hypothetical protein
MASYPFCLVKIFTGQMAAKFSFSLILESLGVLCTFSALSEICVKCYGEKLYFKMQARFYFFWKHRWILNIYVYIYLFKCNCIIVV